MAITPRLRSSASSCSSVFSAPRSLNDAVNCRFSNLIQTSALAMRDRVSLRRQGVRTTSPAMRPAAARTSSRVTGRWVVIAPPHYSIRPLSSLTARERCDTSTPHASHLGPSDELQDRRLRRAGGSLYALRKLQALCDRAPRRPDGAFLMAPGLLPSDVRDTRIKTMAAITVSNLTKSFPAAERKAGGFLARLLPARHTRQVMGEVTVVSDLSFSIAAGERVAFIGPNGAGKSTTLKMLT